MKQEGRRAKTRDKDDILKNKLNKETLQSGDIRVVLDKYQHSSEDTYKNHMRRFAELYEYDFGTDVFKGRNGQYQFEKEWHGLFLTLFENLEDNPKFSRDKKMNVYTIGTTRDYNEKLTDSIESFLPEDQKQYIKSHPLYKLDKAEKNMYKKIEDNIQIIFSNIANMPALRRFQNLVEFNDYLELAAMDITSKNMEYQLKLSEEFIKADKKEKSIIYQEMIEDLEGLLDHELKVRLTRSGDKRPKIDKELTLTGALDSGTDKNEVGNVIHYMMLLGELEINMLTDNEKIKQKCPELVEEIRLIEEKIKNQIKDILDEDSNRDIVERVSNVLDETDPKEKMLKNNIKRMLIQMSIDDVDRKNESRNSIRRIINMTKYNNTLEMASRDD